MRVLFMTCHLPYPPLSGGRRREYELLRRLDHEVTVVAVSKVPEFDRRLVPEFLDRVPAVRQVMVEPVAPQAGRWRRLPSHVARHRCRTAATVVGAAAGSCDLIHVEGYYLMQHLPPQPLAPVLLVEQNVEWQLCVQRGQRRDAELTRTAEFGAWRHADALAALTPEDAQVMREATGRQVALSPNGIEPVEVVRCEPGPATVLFVSNFAYEPNRDAADLLVRRILPLVRRRVRRAELLLVGNDPGGEMRRRYAGRGCRVLGWVPSLAPYYRAATVVVCPLRVGGGVKVTMLEAIAHAKAIVSTPVGVQGLGPAAADAVRVATSVPRLADALVELLTQPGQRRALERATEAFCLRLPTWDHAAEALEATWRATVSTPSSHVLHPDEGAEIR